jgi:glyoxylase-like metal-dependent hydrolase (beta-lactamase superfamily II)
VIDVDQADISPSSALYVSQLGAVIAGDLVYNETHQMLALTGPAEWTRWAASVDDIAALRPRTVVAGHKKPDASDDDGDAILARTKEYILDFARIAEAAASPEEIITAMQKRYPDHGNLTTLLVSAQAAKTGATLSDFADPASVVAEG